MNIFKQYYIEKKIKEAFMGVGLNKKCNLTNLDLEPETKHLYI